MIRITPLLILLCIAVSSCSAPRDILPGAAPTERLAIRSTAAATIAPSPTQPAPSPTPIARALPTVATTPTPPGMAVVANAFRFGQSPNGDWFWGVEGLGSQEEGKEFIAHKTKISSADGMTQWTVWPKTSDTSNVIETQALYEPLFWSPDEQYVYLTGESCCQDGAYGYTGMNLARLDLRTGEFVILIPGWSPHTFAISENGTYLLDTQYKFPKLRFIHLPEWEITDIPVDPAYVHSDIAAFAPEGNRAVVQACKEQENLPGCSGYSLLLVDIPAESYQVIVEDLADASGLADRLSAHELSYDWKNVNELEVAIQRREEASRIFVFDLLTNQLDEIRQD